MSSQELPLNPRSLSHDYPNCCSSLHGNDLLCVQESLFISTTAKFLHRGLHFCLEVNFSQNHELLSVFSMVKLTSNGYMFRWVILITFSDNLVTNLLPLI